MANMKQGTTLGDVTPLLERLGRSATPQVPSNEQNLSLRRLLSDGEVGSMSEESGCMIRGLLSSELLDELKNRWTTSSAIPGDSYQALAADYAGVVIIDRESFRQGPWFGADDYSGRALGEEVYEYCKRARVSGTPVYYVDSAGPARGLTERLRSVVDVVLPMGEVDDMEEGAAVSELLLALDEFAARRNN